MTVSNSNKYIADSASMNHAQRKTDVWEIWERMWWSRWLIISTICLFVLGGLLYNFLTQPIYSADTLLQIEQLKDPTNGSELGDDLTLRGAVSPFTAELQILRSRTVLGSAVDQYQLDIEAAPKLFPLFGQAISRWKESQIYSNNGVESPGNFLQRLLYSWGGGKIKVDTFSIPSRYLDKEFILTALPNNQYELMDNKENVILVGDTGKSASGKNPAGQEFSITVSLLESDVGEEFRLIRKSRVAAVNLLRDKLRISELGVESGIVQIALFGTDPARTVQLLDTIASTYLQKKREEKITVVQKNLDFLETRLPAVKNDLERFEAELNEFRLDRGSIDFNSETESTLKRIVTIETDIQKLNLKRQELRTRFTAQHPNITGLDAQKELLAIELEELENTVNTLPGEQQKYLSLSRNVDVNTKLYTALLGRSQELEIAMASATSDISVLDPATAEIEPVKPRKFMSLLMASLLGAMTGVLLSLFRDSLIKGVEDPAELEKQLLVPVLATIPQSLKQLNINENAAQKGSGVYALAHVYPKDLSIESLRNLRSTLFFQEKNQLHGN